MDKINKKLLSKTDIGIVITIHNNGFLTNTNCLDGINKLNISKWGIEGNAFVFGDYFYVSQSFRYGYKFRSTLWFDFYNKMASLGFKEFLKTIKSNENKFLIETKKMSL